MKPSRTNARWCKLITYIRRRWGVEKLADLLIGANLSGVDLSGVDLSGVDLSGANLWGADLSGADLIGANLWGMDLSGVKTNWQSHDLIAARLLHAAGDDPLKRLAAGYILVSRDWCWSELLNNAPNVTLADGQSLTAWALTEMATWVLDGEAPPEHLKPYMKKEYHPK